jgi:hypothetical protein
MFALGVVTLEELMGQEQGPGEGRAEDVMTLLEDPLEGGGSGSGMLHHHHHPPAPHPPAPHLSER